MLTALSHPSGKKAVTSLLKSGSFRTKFKAPAKGSLSIVWTATKAGKTITIATATAKPGKSGTVNVTVHLTRAGKLLLEQKMDGLATKATEKFKLPGKSWVSVTKRFSL
jgi:hypothetical protein